MTERRGPAMTPQEAAAYLGKSLDWVYEKAAGGVLPSYKIGGHRRFRPEDLDAYIESCREGPASPGGEVRSLSQKRG